MLVRASFALVLSGLLVSAVSAQGCSGGKMEFDDGKYEVDDARCNDGKIYDLHFNPSFELIKKKLEN